MTKFNRLMAMHRQIEKTLSPYVTRNRALMDKLSGVQYEESFYRHAWSYDNELKVSMGWGQIPTRQVEAAVRNRLTLGSLNDLSNHTRTRVRRAITQGLIRGSPLPRMMKDIRYQMGVTTSDAMRIARTEAHRARELGHMAAGERSEAMGVEITRVWDASLDSRTRPTHAALDGAKTGVGKNFPNGPVAPGQWGIASEDINCRCTVIDQIEGYEPTTRRIRGEGVQPYKTFETWAKERGITGNRYGQKYNFVK